MMRNKLLGAVAAVGLLGLLLVPASAPNAAITGSAHDFSGLGWSSGDLCKVCHTPHNGDTTVAGAPLWNHQLTTQTFTNYTSATMDGVSSATGISRLCLSCHDGATAMDNYGGVTTGTATIGAVPGNFGLDLSDDHPIGVDVTVAIAGGDGELHPAATINTDAGVKLYGAGATLVECASCHDVHNNGPPAAGFMLVKDPAGGALCLTCHNK
jgi:predicted CXXCH cytochrome family protein